MTKKRSRDKIEHIIVTDEDISYHKYKKRLNKEASAIVEGGKYDSTFSMKQTDSGTEDHDRNHNPTHLPRHEVEEHTKLTAAAAHVPNYWVPDGYQKAEKNGGKIGIK